jgi:hypothetical protein
MIPLGEIETNIVDRLVTFMENSVSVIAAVSDRKKMRQLMNRFPAMFVIFESEDYDEMLTFDNVQRSGLMRWQVYIFARSMRAETDGARTGDLGTYDISDDARTVLEGFDPINNTDVSGREYPLVMTSRVHAEDQDEQQNDLYVMLMRLSHECTN